MHHMAMHSDRMSQTCRIVTTLCTVSVIQWATAVHNLASMLTLIAIQSVMNMAPKYRQVAIIRPFSNIFLNCAKGPIRNMVLHDNGPH